MFDNMLKRQSVDQSNDIEMHDSENDQPEQMNHENMDCTDYDENVSKSFIACFRQGPRQEQVRQEGQGVRQGHHAEQMNTQVGEYKMHKIMTESKWPVYEAGRVSQCTSKWSQITSDFVILRNLRGYNLEFEEIPNQEGNPREMFFPEQETQFLRNEVKTLLTKKVIKM